MENDERSHRDPHPPPPWEFRGHDLARILALSDGIFAFAMTLLVLNLALPTGVDVRSYLFGPKFWPALYAYAISFLVIAQWWRGHHLVFRYVRGFNRDLVRWNTAFLLAIAIVPFGTTVLNASGNAAIGPIVFSLPQVGAGLALFAVWRTASSENLLRPDFPAAWTRYVTLATLAPPLLFAISIPVALVYAPAAEVAWLGIFAIPLISRRVTGTANASGATPPG